MIGPNENRPINDEEIELWKALSEGDQQARQALILKYLVLVRISTNRILKLMPWASREDLMQDGLIGLMKAIERFDPKRGVAFSAFAKHYIRGAILDSKETTRHVSRRQEESYRQVRRAEDKLTVLLKRVPTVEEIAQEAALTVKQVVNAIEARSVAFADSFELVVEGSREGFERLQELFEAGELSEVAGVEVEDIEWKATDPNYVKTLLIEEAMARLTERETSIVMDYYWQGLTNEEIAEKSGLTHSNVMKIRQRAISKLRSFLQATSASKTKPGSGRKFR
jgi:RNA polymerase sigma factor (sigma-70 family)